MELDLNSDSFRCEHGGCDYIFLFLAFFLERFFYPNAFCNFLLYISVRLYRMHLLMVCFVQELQLRCRIVRVCSHVVGECSTGR